MARFRFIEKSEADPEALEVYEELEAMGGRVLTPFKTIAHSPRLLKRWWRMMVTLISELKLDARLRELAILRVFQITGCQYCFAEHDRIAERVGVPREQIDNIARYREHPAFNETERLVLQYAEAIARDNRVVDEVFARLRERFSEQELVELTFCIANWIGLSHFIVPVGLELESKED